MSIPLIVTKEFSTQMNLKTVVVSDLRSNDTVCPWTHPQDPCKTTPLVVTLTLDFLKKKIDRWIGEGPRPT